VACAIDVLTHDLHIASTPENPSSDTNGDKLESSSRLARSSESTERTENPDPKPAPDSVDNRADHSGEANPNYDLGRQDENDSPQGVTLFSIWSAGEEKLIILTASIASIFYLQSLRGSITGLSTLLQRI